MCHDVDVMWMDVDGNGMEMAGTRVGREGAGSFRRSFDAYARERPPGLSWYGVMRRRVGCDEAFEWSKSRGRCWGIGSCLNFSELCHS